MKVLCRPSEEQFHAYADSQLEESRRQEVEDWLAAHPEDGARIRDWQDLSAGLRQAFAPVLAESVPDRLVKAAHPPATAKTPPARTWLWRSAAAGAWLILGGLVGYGLHGRTLDKAPSPPPLARSAAVAHAVYTPEIRHPVEVGADQEAHLVQWLSKRLATPLRVPHLGAEGYSLVGGRLLPGEAGPVAQFMYEDLSGRRLTLYVRHDARENRETAFRFAQEGPVAVFYWLDGRLGYALSGEMPREKLLGLAESAYQQLNP